MNFVRILIVLFVLVSACKPKTPIEGVFPTSDGGKLDMAYHVEQTQAIVLFYLSPQCPLSVNYTKKINEMQQEYQDKYIEFIGVISGSHYSAQEAEQFKSKYDLKMEIIMDKNFLISNFYNASVTPSVNLLDSTGAVQYAGSIDNWAVSLRRKRIAATQFYLEDAIDAYLAGAPIITRETEAIGCIIE